MESASTDVLTNSTPLATYIHTSYVSLSRDKEPGKESYDFKSTSWASLDEIVIAPSTSVARFSTLRPSPTTLRPHTHRP